MKNIYLTFMTKDFAPTELYKTDSICITKVTPLTGLISNPLGGKSFATLCNTIKGKSMVAPWRQNLYFKKNF